MKYLLLLIPLIFSGYTKNSSAHLSQQDVAQEDTIFWKADSKLVWDDFKGPAPETGFKVAATYSGFSFTFHSDENNFRLKTFVYFIRSRSWTRTAADNVLLHEQGHFNLTEISARKFWKIIKAKHLDQVKNSEAKKKYAQIKEIYHTITAELSEIQDKYDNETKHSTIQEKQDLWNERIQKQLTELEDYSQ